MMNLINRIEKLEAALETAKADEAEARACGVTLTDTGAIMLMEAAAIRKGIELRITELQNELFDLQGFEIMPGEIVPVSGLIDAEDRF